MHIWLSLLNQPPIRMHSQHRKLQNDREDSLLSTAIELERHCYSRLRSSNDFREGVEAFHGKRQSKFNGS